MIEMNFEEFSLFIISVCVLTMGLLLFVHSFRSRSYRRKRFHQVVQCPVCGEVFDDRSAEKMPKCTGCGRKTIRGYDKSLG
jgi:rRNA maturation endonuclease Nob1